MDGIFGINYIWSFTQLALSEFLSMNCIKSVNSSKIKQSAKNQSILHTPFINISYQINENGNWFMLSNKSLYSAFCHKNIILLLQNDESNWMETHNLYPFIRIIVKITSVIEKIQFLNFYRWIAFSKLTTHTFFYL